MIIALLIAGILFFLAGALGIFLGIPVKEFSFGNTLILAGVVAGCTGMLTLGLAAVIRELKQIAERLESGAVAAAPSPQPAAAGAVTHARLGASRGPRHSLFSGSSMVLLMTSMEKLAFTSSRSTASIRRR